MDQDASLEALEQRAGALDKAVRDLDLDIERTMHAIAGGGMEAGHAMLVFQDQRNDQLGLMFELGKVTAQIDDLQARNREMADQGYERQTVADWEREALPTQEDYLDWMRPELEAASQTPAGERVHVREAEERMLTEMEREDRAPVDYLDWDRR